MLIGGLWNRPHRLTGLPITLETTLIGPCFGSGLGIYTTCVVLALGKGTVWPETRVRCLGWGPRSSVTRGLLLPSIMTWPSGPPWGTSHPWDQAIGSTFGLPFPKLNVQFGLFLEKRFVSWSGWAPLTKVILDWSSDAWTYPKLQNQI